MTFTAVLPPNVTLPEETWLPALVRRHGSDLEVTADAASSPAQLPSSERAQSLAAWLARCAAQPVSALTAPEVEDMRWQRLQEKHQL
jgi:hypothetical protein